MINITKLFWYQNAASIARGMLSRQNFSLSGHIVAVNLICTGKKCCVVKATYLCVQYWSAVVYNVEVVVKQELPSIHNYPDLHYAPQYRPKCPVKESTTLTTKQQASQMR